MKVLLDENLPHSLRNHLPGHDVSTVWYMGWNGLKNGELLQTAESHGMEVFLTGDLNLSYQQNLAGRRLAIVVLSAQNWSILRLNLLRIVQAVDSATPGSFQEVPCDLSLL